MSESVTEKLIGKKWKPGIPDDYIKKDDGIFRVPITIESAVLAVDHNAIIINGKYIMPIGLAPWVIDGEDGH